MTERASFNPNSPVTGKYRSSAYAERLMKSMRPKAPAEPIPAVPPESEWPFRECVRAVYVTAERIVWDFEGGEQ